MRLKTFIFSVLTMLVIGAVSIMSVAQELCEALAREAFETVDDNCAGIDAENACYGFNTLNATFNADIADAASFGDPADLIEVIQLHTVRTSPYDEEEEEWGIGYFQIPVEGQDPVVVMMAGDVIVENAIEIDETDAVNPLQNFNFTTAGASSCRQTPNAVFIQSPPNIPVDLTINSTPIRLGSTVVIGTELDENGEEMMWFSVLEGKVTIFPDTPQAQTIPQGFYSTVLLSDEEGKGIDDEEALDTQLVPVLDKITGEPIIGPGGEPFYRRVPVTTFTEPEALTEDGEGFRGTGAYTFVNLIPETLINYPVEVATEENAPATSTHTAAPARPTFTSTPQPLLGSSSCGEDANWCNPGQPWGDGRCNDPNPDVASWYWQAGYYNAQLECGAIKELPPQFAPATATSIPILPTATFTPGIPTPIVLGAPTQLSPADGTVFNNFPRDTTLTWAAVPGAASYEVEREFCQPGVTNCQPDGQGIYSESGTSHNFTFGGAQPGRWRVRAIATDGTPGAWSPWWVFTYTV